MSDGLRALGWTARWEALAEPHVTDGLTPARVLRRDRGGALLGLPTGVVAARVSPRLARAAAGSADLPATGDWVVALAPDDLDTPLIETVLERTSAIVRGDPGPTSDVQVLAANVDTVLVVHPIAEAPNVRRIEREISMAWESGAIPVVVLSKADLSPDRDAARAAVESVALGVDVLLTSSHDEASVEPVAAYLSGHRTAVLLGPSGAGKSTLVNALLGEKRQATGDVRVSDGRGRHTTVARELVEVAGGILIDTPGLRALGLTGSEDGIAATFLEIEELAGECRFRDCAHQDEPGCAVRAAVDSGVLSADRLAGYHKLMREAHVAAARTDVHARMEENRKRKVIHKALKEHYKQSGRG